MSIGLCFSLLSDIIDAFGVGEQSTVALPMIKLCLS